MATASDHPVVTTTTGPVRGRELAGGVVRFLGIPYAAAPFGPNRMQPPQPADTWVEPRDCAEFAATVPKGDYPPHFAPLFAEVTIDGDECLNVNVWSPGLDGAHPVLVWIHGGSFMNGSNSVAEYDGAAFARDGVVLVSINYRLAAEGFLYLGDGVANLGLQDQVAALRWVHENIASFGGDPDQVTVAGESAGAMSVSTLLTMSSARGLFTRAITQSGATAHTITPEQGLMVSRFLAESLGVEPTRAAIAGVDLDTLIAAASDLVTEVQTSPDPAKWGPLAMSLLPFAPVIDGDVLTRHPLEAMADGAGSDVTVLTGSTRDEARLFLVAPQTIDLIDEPTFTATAQAYGLDQQAIETYARNRPDASPGDLVAAVVTDWFFGIPALRVAETRARVGGAPTWVYRFDYPDPADNGGYGSAHAAEIPFVFDTLHEKTVAPRLGDHPSQAVADAAHRVWVDFVTTGSPGWTSYDLNARHVGLITDIVADVSDPTKDEREAWESVR
ncbi:carboxylesterase/lipase family protein [Gordonia insulae]|uniref:Carboxylic ester hydrolase n=1 Tax=Gordonia insulae TaxID=2420509 RepID=A0A3G8JWP7_9ACTN|nr:carboxylesterase family protein [Gordonia insulae]AZG48630.1 Carboxylesterase [Gordonia insulae]